MASTIAARRSRMSLSDERRILRITSARTRSRGLSPTPAMWPS
jgi:hypothetical protein